MYNDELFEWLKHYHFSELEHSDQLDHVLNNYSTKRVDINEPLDGFYVCMRHWFSDTDWSGTLMQQYNDSKPFGIINRLGTSFDSGEFYKGVYFDNKEDLDKRKQIVDNLISTVANIYKVQQFYKRNQPAKTAVNTDVDDRMDKLNKLIARVGIYNTIKILESVAGTKASSSDGMYIGHGADTPMY